MLTIPAKRILVFALIVGLVFSLGATTFAQEEGTTTDEVEEMDVPGVLPTNPFYFFKELTRGVRRFFTFDSVKRAEFELEVLSEKADELDAVEELNPNDIDAIEGAVENYDENVDRLRELLERLSGDSNNPNIDRLLDRLTDRALRHHELFDGIVERHSDLRIKVDEVQDDLDGTVRPVFDKIGTCEEFKERVQALVEEDQSPRAILRALRLIDRLEDHADNSGHGNCFGELEDRLVDLLEDLLGDDVDIDELIDKLPGGDRVRLRIVDEIRDGLDVRSRFRFRLDDFRLDVLERIGDSDVGAEDVRDMIADAEGKINKLRERIANGKYEVPPASERLLSEAEALLQNARAAFEDGRYGAAFGEANAARRTAGAGLSHLIEIGGEDRPHDDDDDSDEDDHVDDDSHRGRGFKAIDIRGGDIVACIELYSPVCGKNGKTYSNECFAKVAGVDIDHEGACGTDADSDDDSDGSDIDDDLHDADETDAL